MFSALSFELVQFLFISVEEPVKFLWKFGDDVGADVSTSEPIFTFQNEPGASTTTQYSGLKLVVNIKSNKIKQWKI